jgi:RHH-type proline utilization regulon transcriptional repressor/proline dehydrogenase/delta 1-pyrroline-5-carboxylate dehydrogenase
MPINHQERVTRAVMLAQQWQNRANQLLTRQERRLQRQLQRLLSHPRDKVLLSRLIDQSFRSRNGRRVAEQLRNLLREQGPPHFLGPLQNWLLRLFIMTDPRLVAPFIPFVVQQMRRFSQRLIIPGEPDSFRSHLRRRRAQGVRMNINHLGEAVLGEEEAFHRLTTSINDLKDPEIEYISIKISTLYSQINPLAFEATVAILQQRLATIYRVAQQHFFTNPHGTTVPKFVNLDMEEYRDLAITCQAFVRTLSQEEFLHYSAGIVLQAYLPDSFAVQQELTLWARQRLANGGAPIKLRIVKGANLEMEKLESALNNWPLAPFATKSAVDANYKRMVEFGMQPENIAAVHLGIASHNLFDLAYAATLAKERGVEPVMCFEMLEGMADHIRRALQEDFRDVLLYAPVAGKEEFINAVAYLIRRLDENTAPNNFLRHAPQLTVESEAWRRLKEDFCHSCVLQDHLPQTPHRVQNRQTESFAPTISPVYSHRFVNEADTDWSLSANRMWAEAIRNRWMRAPGCTPEQVPLVIGGQLLGDGRPILIREDINQAGVLLARCAMATAEDIGKALTTAAADPDGWRALGTGERQRILAQAAMELRRCRGDLIGAAAAETGKIFTEADPEVSEAIDFTELYPHAVTQFAQMPNLQVSGKGVALVIAPWNFPIAIPCGGIAAALASGNTVIFKPSSEAVLTGFLLCQCFWRAGVSRNALQFVPCSGAQLGSLLTASPLVDIVILTGGTETGLRILRHTPGVALAAETGGKNATIVTEMADRDQAIKHVLHSAFSNCGQKCSATSLLILEESVYHDQQFRRQLVDAAASLQVGPAWQFENRLGPLIRPPSGDLLRALTTLEPGEQWALQPRPLDTQRHLWTPGIKYGVKPGGFTHMTEFFGPLLGVLPARDLKTAIALVNQTGYGLTSGLESLDTREHTFWKERIVAGNLYINRSTTGAVVLRQPFGGFGKSSIGLGIKAGSLEYVTQFMHIAERHPPVHPLFGKHHRLLLMVQQWHHLPTTHPWFHLREDLARTEHAIASYLGQMESNYGRCRDSFHLRGQDNHLRYLPMGMVVIRIHDNDSLFETLARIAAAVITGCTATASLPPNLANPATAFLESQRHCPLLEAVAFTVERDEDLALRLGGIDRLRYAAADRVPPAIARAAAEQGITISQSPVFMEGRLELLQYLRQQTICHNYHRYGNVGERDLPMF